MLFSFPAEIKLADLPGAMEHWARLLDDSPIDSVSQVQISLLGWRGNERYELKGNGGFAPFVIFDRCYDLANRPLPDWVPRLSSSLSENQDRDVLLRRAGWFKRHD
jgi:hypothetical protein